MSPERCIIIACLLLPILSFAQKDKLEQFVQLPDKFFSRVNNKVARLDEQLVKQTEKYLRRLAKKEEKLKRKLSRVDSAAARQLFSTSPAD